MPFYPDHVLDEIRNSIDIVPFISEHVALKKRGRNHVACCPFHNEKTPSFNVNAEKQIFMCFGCGVGGDVFKFAMLVEHFTFQDAVLLLVGRYTGLRRSAPGVAAQESTHAPDARGLRADQAFRGRAPAVRCFSGPDHVSYHRCPRKSYRFWRTGDGGSSTEVFEFAGDQAL